MITLFLEPRLEPFSILIAVLLVRIGEAAIRGRDDLHRLSRQLSWGHGALTCLWLITGTSPSTAADLFWILLRSILASRICLGAWAIILPACAKLWSVTIGRMLSAIRNANAAAIRRVHEQQLAEQEQQRAERDRIAAEHRRQEQHEEAIRKDQLESERWLQKQEADARARIARDVAGKDEQRREEARLRSELLYQQHARQLGTSFPRKRLDQFLDRYLGHDASPDEVEQRERMLKQMMLDSLGTNTPVKFSSMGELAAYYQARREEIDRLPHDEEVKDTYRIQLNKQEDEALRRMLKP